MRNDGACWRCRHWKGSLDKYIGKCPIIKKITEGDESCQDFEPVIHDEGKEGIE